MNYGIRVSDGRQVGTIIGNVDNFNVPDGETLETFDDEQAFADRLAELNPDPPPDPDDDLREAIEAATTLNELKAALLGTDRPARVAGRPTE